MLGSGTQPQHLISSPSRTQPHKPKGEKTHDCPQIPPRHAVCKSRGGPGSSGGRNPAPNRATSGTIRSGARGAADSAPDRAVESRNRARIGGSRVGRERGEARNPPDMACPRGPPLLRYPVPVPGLCCSGPTPRVLRAWAPDNKAWSMGRHLTRGP